MNLIGEKNYCMIKKRIYEEIRQTYGHMSTALNSFGVGERPTINL